METEKELKEQIMDATILEFNENGVKFTMDDVARRLNISKKTIYTVFHDKEALLLEAVDYCFGEIKESEQEILDKENVSVVDKLRRVLVVLPERYEHLDFRKIYMMKERYPKIYEKIAVRIESGWDSTIMLLEEGIRQGLIKDISIPVLKLMVEASIEQFISRKTLIDSNIPYEEALEQMIEILMEGICTKST